MEGCEVKRGLQGVLLVFLPVLRSAHGRVLQEKADGPPCFVITLAAASGGVRVLPTRVAQCLHRVGEVRIGPLLSCIGAAVGPVLTDVLLGGA